MDKGLIIIVVGLLLTITVYGCFIGIPLIILGIYLTYKTLKENEKCKKLNNLEEEYTKKEKKLKEKQNQLDNIDKKLDQLEKERIDQIDKDLANRETDLDKRIAEKEEQINILDEKYEKLSAEKEKELDKKIYVKKSRYDVLTQQVKDLEKERGEIQEDIDLQDYGLYEPKYNFINATDYKEKLDAVRKQQKQMIKDKTAAVGTTEWTVKGSKSKGKALNNANIKQILRSFNNETEVIIGKVKHSNLESSKNRIQKSFNTLNNLYKREDVHLTQEYLNLKLDEMHLAYEYEVKKQEEKEELREARKKENEEKKIQKELEKERKKFERENETINTEIEDLKAKMAQSAAEEKAKLEAEIVKLQEALNKNNKEVEKINEWKETRGAGYVYIISNIGSFGKDVFKIGVTRRDNPEVRIHELSSASVPFNYDAHVFIFSKDAYDLEKKLHKRFDKQRVNKVNMRKEFFYITLNDIKQIVEENKGAVHSFVEHPDAEEYFDTLKIEKKRSV